MQILSSLREMFSNAQAWITGYGPRKRESIGGQTPWIPAFAGMTP